MTNPNEKQVGGEHYKSTYQHWDFVCDTNMPYLLGCATKYLTRWRKKNGVQDLEKAIHYLQKAQERYVGMTPSEQVTALTERFCDESVEGQDEKDIVDLIVRGQLYTAISEIE